MKRWMCLAALFCGWAFVPLIQAQDSSLNHVQIGAFGEFLRLNQTKTNLGGLGGRFGVNLAPHLQLEAEAGYLFNQVFTESFTSSSGAVSAVNSDVRVLHGLFGPKLQTTGPVRIFVTAKGGAIDFMFDTRPRSFDSVLSARLLTVRLVLLVAGFAGGQDVVTEVR